MELRNKPSRNGIGCHAVFLKISNDHRPWLQNDLDRRDIVVTGLGAQINDKRPQ